MEDFEADGEVKDGLYKCIESMVPNLSDQDVINKMLPDYSESKGTFGKTMAIQHKTKD